MLFYIYLVYIESEQHFELEVATGHNTGATPVHNSATIEHRRAIDRVARDVAAFLTASCVGKVVLLHDNGDQ